MFGLDPLLATFLVAGGLLWLGYKAGQWDLQARVRATIDFVMDQMILDGYVFASIDNDGDTVIVALKDLSPDQLRQVGHIVVDPATK